MSTTTNVDSLKINILTKAQYNNATKDANQLYLVTDDTIDNATTSKDGLMSSNDKINLDKVVNYVGDSSVSSQISSAISNKANTNHTHSDATTSASGFMSSSDKTKLNGIATGATKVTVDSALSSTSTNAIQNKVVNSALSGKAESSHTHSNYASTVTTSGSGNAITSISQSGNTITATKGSTFLTEHPSITKSNDSTSTATPAHGGSFTAVDSITRDSNGHVTKVNTKTITLPTVSSNDTQVTQTLTSSNASYPLLLAPSGQTSTKTTTSYFDSGVTLNPSTNTIAANISGSAGSATKATQDGSGNTITSTYLKLSGGTVTGNLIVNGNYLYVGSGTSLSSTKISAPSIVATDSLQIGSDTVTDYVVAESIGSSTSWNYLKWASGKAECWIKTTVSYANTSVLTKTISLPFTFSESPVGVAILNDSGQNAASALYWNCKAQFDTKTANIAVHDVKAGFSSGTSKSVSVIVEGKWK